MQNKNSALKKAAHLFQRNQLAEAEHACHKAIKKSPQSPQAHNLLGLIYRQQGELQNAAKAANLALSFDPQFADAYLNLGHIFYLAGDQNAAREAFSKSISCNSPGFDCYFDCANFFRATGFLEESLELYHRALEIQPANIEVYLSLSDSLKKLNRPADLIPINKKALQAAPDNEFVHFNLGVAYLATGQNELAIDACQKAVDCNPQNSTAYFNMGRAHANIHQLNAAIDAFEKVIQLNSNHIGAYCCLAEALEHAHKLDAASDIADRGLALQPGNTTLLTIKAQLLRRGNRIDEAIQILESIESRAPESSNDYALKFELARLYDRENQTEKAWKKLLEANHLQAVSEKSRPYRAEKFQDELAMLHQLYNTDWLSGWNELASTPHPRLVFLVGFPRSGTTLLEQILNAHPGIQSLEEKDCLHAAENFQLKSGGSVFSSLTNMSIEDVYAARDKYFDEISKHIDYQPDKLLIDKFPLNITRAATVARIFPQAKFILALRHPCDACLSNFMQTFGMNDAMANFLSIDSTVKTYVNVMGLWEKFERVFEPEFYTHRYEDLIEDFDTSVRALISFLDLEWTDSILQYRQSALDKEKINTPSYSQVVEPIYQRASYRWIKYSDQFAPFLKQLEPFIERFGYQGINREP